MKYTEGSYGMRLEGIKEEDLKYRNLAGRLDPNNRYDNPNNPAHVLVLWIDDDEIADALKDFGFNVKEYEDKEGKHPEDVGRLYLQFKAYPKMKVNRVTGKEEQAPKVIKITSKLKRQLPKAEFGDFDSAHIEEIDISFHGWEYEKGKFVASLDQVWYVADESAGGANDDEEYFNNKYGHLKTYEGDEEPDEVPFE